MPSEREEVAPPKTTRRRTSAASSNVTSPNVTEAKRPTSATSGSGITMPVTETPLGLGAGNAEDEIRRRAYELYEQDGREHGRDREHWLRAEAEILGRAQDARERDARHQSETRASARVARSAQKSA